MYHFRYYAIGHSFLRHPPFSGWQTRGFWGMAATEPSKDYFHRFQARLGEALDCKIEAIAENQCIYEGRCVLGATREDYENSPEYHHMKEILQNFKPNIISVFVGGGNTVANDEESLSFFYDVLYGMIAKYKRPDTVVICPTAIGRTLEPSNRAAKKYGFIPVEISFLSGKEKYENPYYAFHQYPEYDERAANKAIEFRYHPGNLGHDKIAETMINAAIEGIKEKISEGPLGEPYEFEKYLPDDFVKDIQIKTNPHMLIEYNGFNVRSEGDCIAVCSSPGTGVSVSSSRICLPPDYKRFCIEIDVDSPAEQKNLCLTVQTKSGEHKYTAPVCESGIARYEFDISDVSDVIQSFSVYPDLEECILRVKSVRFEK